MLFLRQNLVFNSMNNIQVSYMYVPSCAILHNLEINPQTNVSHHQKCVHVSRFWKVHLCYVSGRGVVPLYLTPRVDVHNLKFFLYVREALKLRATIETSSRLETTMYTHTLHFSTTMNNMYSERRVQPLCFSYSSLKWMRSLFMCVEFKSWRAKSRRQTFE